MLASLHNLVGPVVISVFPVQHISSVLAFKERYRSLIQIMI